MATLFGHFSDSHLIWEKTAPYLSASRSADILVGLPEYQGQGIGTQILKYLAARSKARNVLLHSVPGKERFFEKLGYRRMKTAMGLFADSEVKRQQGYVE